MTQNNAAQALLMLMVSPKLEEVLVDFLLQQPAIGGFTTAPASGHGTRQGVHGAARLSLVEQVTGRQNRVQFMIHAALPELHALIAALKAEFSNADLHYILLPVLEASAI